LEIKVFRLNRPAASNGLPARLALQIQCQRSNTLPHGPGLPFAFRGTKSPHGFFGMAMRRLEQVTVGRRTRAGSIERSNSDALDRCENNPGPKLKAQSSKLKKNSKPQSSKVAPQLFSCGEASLTDETARCDGGVLDCLNRAETVLGAWYLGAFLELWTLSFELALSSPGRPGGRICEFPAR